MNRLDGQKEGRVNSPAFFTASTHYPLDTGCYSTCLILEWVQMWGQKMTALRAPDFPSWSVSLSVNTAALVVHPWFPVPGERLCTRLRFSHLLQTAMTPLFPLPFIPERAPNLCILHPLSFPPAAPAVPLPWPPTVCTVIFPKHKEAHITPHCPLQQK